MGTRAIEALNFPLVELESAVLDGTLLLAFQGGNGAAYSVLHVGKTHSVSEQPRSSPQSFPGRDFIVPELGTNPERG
jgi:hypothetical protein